MARMKKEFCDFTFKSAEIEMKKSFEGRKIAVKFLD